MICGRRVCLCMRVSVCLHSGIPKAPAPLKKEGCDRTIMTRPAPFATHRRSYCLMTAKSVLGGWLLAWDFRHKESPFLKNVPSTLITP